MLGPEPGTDSEDALQAALDELLGAGNRIISVTPLAYRSSYPIDVIELESRGKQRVLVRKNLAWETLTEEAQAAKPAFLYNPLREVEVYRDVLVQAGEGPGFIGSSFDKHSQRCWLFLEFSPGTELNQFGEIEVWQAVASWLARFHTHFSELGPGALPDSLLIHNAHYYYRWLDRAIAFASEAADVERRRRRAVLSRVQARYEDVLERLLSSESTLIHGEFYATNILVLASAGRSPDVRPIDWENAAWGPALTDLATLTAGSWPEEQRRAIIGSYYEALPPQGRGSLPSLERTLTYFRIQLAVQWLGWSSTWQPPPDKAHDWLAELELLMDQLG